MTNDIYLDKLHKDIIDIMDYIHFFCLSHDIKYYLVGGSLLGAIRHRGFIPWDDDLDIAMPRDDYEKFLMNFCSSTGRYSVLSPECNPRYEHGFSKIVMNGTVFKERFVMEWPIFVDVFPLDETRGKLFLLKCTKEIYKLSEEMWARRTRNYSLSIRTLFSRIFGCNSYSSLQRNTISKDNNKGYGFYTNFLSQYSVERQTMPKEWYGDGIEVEFEGRKYIAPVEYKKYLNQLYGANYMDIPPTEKRRTHYPLYVRFSDGEEMYFDTPEKRISIKESLE